MITVKGITIYRNDGEVDHYETIPFEGIRLKDGDRIEVGDDNITFVVTRSGAVTKIIEVSKWAI